MHLAPALPVSTPIGRLDIRWHRDPNVVLTNPVGRWDGYTTVRAATDTALGASVGNLPAAAVLRLGDRFFGFHLGRANTFADRIAGTSTQNDGPLWRNTTVPFTDPLHLSDPGQRFVIEDPRVVALVDDFRIRAAR